MENSLRYDKVVRIGIVGLGSWGRTYHRHALTTEGLEIAAVCDVNPGRLTQLLETEIGDRAPRPHAYCHFGDMIDNESLDAVFVSTLAFIRPEIAQVAMCAGSHAIVAKPLAKTLSELEATIAVSNETNKLLLAGFNFRFRADVQVVKRFIDDGGVGRLLFARLFSRTQGVPQWGPHYISAQSGGGSVANTAIHSIDLAHWLVGSPELAAAVDVCHSRFGAMPDIPEN